MEDCIFCQIRDGIIPKEFTYQDRHLMVFPDIHPIKPVHLLIMPKKHMRDFVDCNDIPLLIRMKRMMQKMIEKYKLGNRGYRLVVNGGGAQIVEHLHVHLIGPMAYSFRHNNLEEKSKDSKKIK